MQAISINNYKIHFSSQSSENQYVRKKSRGNIFNSCREIKLNHWLRTTRIGMSCFIDIYNWEIISILYFIVYFYNLNNALKFELK